jgi:hypothetical protein
MSAEISRFAHELMHKVLPILNEPFMGFVWDPEPRMFNPNVAVGERLMLPGSHVEHSTHHTFEGRSHSWVVSHVGYWYGDTVVTLRDLVEFRGEVPVWSMSTHWRYEDKALGDKDVVQEVYRARVHADQARGERSRALSANGQPVFWPRYRGFHYGSSRTGEPDALCYRSEWVGDAVYFSGNEWVVARDSKETLWQASFHGGLIVPIA